MVATTLWPSGGIAAIWDDASRSFGAESGGPDVVLQVAPDFKEPVDTSLMWVTNWSFYSNLSYAFTPAQYHASGLNTDPPGVVFTAPLPPNESQPVAVAFEPNGDMWQLFCSGKLVPQRLMKFSASKVAATGAPQADVSIILPYVDASYRRPTTLAFDAMGKLWVGFVDNHIISFNPEQLLVSGAPTPQTTLTSSAFSEIVDMFFDSRGNLFVDAYARGNSIISRLSPADLGASNPAITPAVQISLPGADGIALGAHGDLWVSDWDHNQVLELSASDLYASGSPTPLVVLSNVPGPEGIAFDRLGNLWVADYNDNEIFGYAAADITTSGEKAPVTTLTGGGALNTPFMIRFSPQLPMSPAVTWLSPSVPKLNISSDADPLSPGWQGSLSVQTDLAGTGATVQFSSQSGTLGGPVPVDSTGKATSLIVTLPDGPSVKLTATTSAVPGHESRTSSLTVLVDTLPPAAIADLAASVPAELRRQTAFRLAWTSPSDHGASVSTYDVRVSKGTPITSANFDAQERIAYWGTARASGNPDRVDVPERLIETDYYFAVAAIDQAGNRGPASFVGPAAAHFNSKILSVGIADQLFGWATDGSTSLDGDAYSDLIVGAAASNTVSIYFGSPSGYSDTAGATIVGEPAINPCVGSTLDCFSFGRAVSVVGDIDSDGLPDLAIGHPLENGSGNVYIFKGRQPWPTLLHESDADYVVVGGAGFSGSSNGTSLARLGDFNGDGIDDFSVGATGYGGVGRASIVYGVPPGVPFGNVSLPADYGTRALAIDGSGTAFSNHMISLGRFYPGAGSTLAASGNGLRDDAPPLSNGKVLAFHGRGTAGPVPVPDHTFIGPIPNGRTGLGLAFLGSGGSFPLVGIGSPAYLNNPGNGQVDIFTGDAAAGPFSGTRATYTDSRAIASGDSFGVMVMGGAFADGTTVSFIGDSAPDVVLGALRENGNSSRLYFLTAQNAGTPGTRDIVAAADISLQLPADWRGCSAHSSAIKDLNGDSYGDIAVGEFSRTSSYPGRVIVLW